VPETSPHVLATAFALARSLNKIPVQAGIGEGFIGNRLLTIMYRQAERVVLAGVSPTDVDNAMREFGFAMGPFEAQDRIGPDAAALRRRAAHENDTNESGGLPQQALNQNDIVHALLFPVVNEGSKILAEDVAKRATDIDLVAIHACGFPRRCGGPMHFATAHGLKAVVNELDRIHAMGLAAPPCGMLRRAASEGDWPAAGS
jgi:3-hydroxyacyl-CoA dehydrogenase